jgi:phospholipid/cholesterol/gamma-HCH transport system substrate-binding protein
LAIIIFVAGVFILGGQQKRFVSSVRIKAVFNDVAGLKPGNNVWFSGVKIGTVKKIDFYGASQVQITLNIEEKAQQYIRKDAHVRISSESLIGNKIIVVFGGSQKAPAVQDGDLLVAENPLDTDELMEKLQVNNENLVAITNDFKVLSSRLVQGQGTIGALLKDSTMAQNFRNSVANLQQASGTAVKATGELAQFTSRMNNKTGLANQLFTDTVVFNQLRGSVAELKQTTSSATGITDNLQQLTTKLNSPNNTVGVLLTDEQFANQLRNTMRNLESGSNEFGETMKAVQNNFLLKGYFKRKAVRDARNAAKQQEKLNNQQKIKTP